MVGWVSVRLVRTNLSGALPCCYSCAFLRGPTTHRRIQIIISTCTLRKEKGSDFHNAPARLVEDFEGEAEEEGGGRDDGGVPPGWRFEGRERRGGGLVIGETLIDGWMD
jgi:hypothetical protein